MNRCNSPRPHSRNIKSENKKREHTKQDIPKVTRHKIEDEDAHTAMEGRASLLQGPRGPSDPVQEILNYTAVLKALPPTLQYRLRRLGVL